MAAASLAPLPRTNSRKVVRLFSGEMKPFRRRDAEKRTNRATVNSFAAARPGLELESTRIEEPFERVESRGDQPLFDSRDRGLRGSCAAAELPLAQV
jgi:hypothetical protein